MGVKRPFEEENLPELSFENAKQPDSKKASVMEDLPDGMLESGSKDGAPVVDEGLEARAPSSSATSSSSSSEEDIGNRDSSSSSNIPGRLDLNMPWRPPNQFGNPYVYLLNVPPREQVPVGPGHQAEVPEWDLSTSGENIPGSNNSRENEWEQKMLGACIIPMPGFEDSSIDGGSTVGRGGSDCSCADKGFPRCVQQHVKEARDKLLETIGEETFTELGFEEMGVEVACRWTDDEEKLFYEVVVGNPASRGRNFWKQLSAVFPTRTKRELVSYYFNVFVLFRRAIQNRSFWPIDSDNDEEPGAAPANNLPEGAEEVDDLQHNHEDSPLTGGDEDSEAESSSDEDLFAGSVDGFGLEPKKDAADEGSKGR